MSDDSKNEPNNEIVDTLSNTQARLQRFFIQEVDTFLLSTRLESDTDEALKNISHVILWACALDEFYQKHERDYEQYRISAPNANVILGVRYARNRAIHQFTQLLYITEGAELPALLPMPLFEVRWKPISLLPIPDKGYEQKKLEAFYKTHLERQSVRYAFEDLKAYFAHINSLFLQSV